MDDFDYENYGMEYDEYNSSGKDSSAKSESAVEPEVEEDRADAAGSSPERGAGGIP